MNSVLCCAVVFPVLLAMPSIMLVFYFELSQSLGFYSVMYVCLVLFIEVYLIVL